MDVSGLLLVDKPLDMTSHDVVNILRKKLMIKKIGHAGTLDPQATGLLLIMVGKKATRAAGCFSGLDKTYQATLTLGVKTDSADHVGTVIETKDIPELSESFIQKTFDSFKGSIRQIPPMVSAKKINGEKLYKLARKGIEVAREAVDITISELDILQVRIPDIDFRVRCSKGTYVRTLCEDIGYSLGSCAHMNGLRRLAVGDFLVDDAVSVADIKGSETEEIIKRLIDIEKINI